MYMSANVILVSCLFVQKDDIVSYNKAVLGGRGADYHSSFCLAELQ